MRDINSIRDTIKCEREALKKDRKKKINGRVKIRFPAVNSMTLLSAVRY